MNLLTSMGDKPQQETKVRGQLPNAIQHIRAYANSHGHFNDAADLRLAIPLAQQCLKSAQHL